MQLLVNFEGLRVKSVLDRNDKDVVLGQWSRQRTISSRRTSKRARAISTQSRGPVTTSSAMRSVSRPAQPPEPRKGRVFWVAALVTTMRVYVWWLISSRRRRNSAFGSLPSITSDRVTRIATRVCDPF